MNTQLRKQGFLALKILAGAAIAASIISALSTYRHELAHLHSISWTYVFISFFLCLSYRLANAHGWSIILDSLGQKLGARQTLHIWLTAEACRWLPGSVWSYGSRAVQATRAGVNSATAGASLMLELLVTLLAWIITAAVTLVLYRETWIGIAESLPLYFIGWGVGICIAMGGFAFLCRPISQKIGQKLRGVQNRFRMLSEVKPKWNRVAMAAAYYTTLCFFNGVAFHWILCAVTPDSNVPLMAIIGANAVAWIVGFFAIFAPGGLVVREGVLATILLPWLPIELAITASILWRVIQVSVELFCLAMVYAIPLVRRCFTGEVVSDANAVT